MAGFLWANSVGVRRDEESDGSKYDGESMMTSWHATVFCFTGPLWRESSGGPKSQRGRALAFPLLQAEKKH